MRVDPVRAELIGEDMAGRGETDGRLRAEWTHPTTSTEHLGPRADGRGGEGLPH